MRTAQIGPDLRLESLYQAQLLAVAVRDNVGEPLKLGLILGYNHPQHCLTGLYFYFLLIGLFAAAHDLNLEWVIVKGISHFSDDSNPPDESWKSFASIMAASLVSNMLSDPVVFKEWPHYEGM